jgi:hypothetical protein
VVPEPFVDELVMPFVDPDELSRLPVVCVPVFGTPGVAVEALYQSATPMTRSTKIIAAATQYAVVDELFISISEYIDCQ